MNRPDLRFAVLGTGRITRRLVADLQSTDGVSVEAIASRDMQRARWCCEQYGIANAVEGYQQAIQRDDVDAVYIALPPSMHAAWAIASARHGKHLLCEKPLAMNMTETARIDAACEDANVRWLDATGWLHHQRTRTFKQWIAEGRLGEVGHVSASVSFYRPFQSNEHRLDGALGGGCLLDLGWYVAGAVQFTISALQSADPDVTDSSAAPVTVRAEAAMEQNVPIRLTAMVKVEGGLSATLSCGYDTATRKWFEIAGSECSLICDDFTRPWAQRATRCWIHDATGAVESHEFTDCQERSMIKRLASEDDLKEFQCQAIWTQAFLDAMQDSIDQGSAAITVGESPQV